MSLLAFDDNDATGSSDYQDCWLCSHVTVDRELGRGCQGCANDQHASIPCGSGKRNITADHHIEVDVDLVDSRVDVSLPAAF